ncbi:MAG: hypothetical protein LBP59_07430 [Planctomycetaceae bacterium]|nr:hypothetical protein [Planctomycetaceae bacterium]
MQDIIGTKKSCPYQGRVWCGLLTAGQRPAVMKIPSLSGRRQVINQN